MTTAPPCASDPRARFAIYWAPPVGAPLERLGANWLGRDPSGTELPPPAIAELGEARWRKLIQAPRHYGLHATLKPPFRLAEGTTERALAEAVAALAADIAPFSCPPLGVRRLDGFLALTPSVLCPPLDDLAARCVQQLDRFRRLPDQDELARRRSAGLTERQERNLSRWGYPYVLDDFRFHVTLTERLDDGEAAPLTAILSDMFGAAARACEIAEIAVFAQPDTSAPFRPTARFKLGRKTPDRS
jgi:putative phosphonate metabolism protein